MTAEKWRGLALAIFATVTAGIITLIRRYTAAADGGDLCRDVVDVRRVLAGQDPYAPFTACGALHHSPHPPLNVLLVVPLGNMPILAAAAVWDGLMLAALVAALAILWRELWPSGGPPWLLGPLAVLVVWPPLLDTWLEAQIGPLILLLIALAWRARRHDQPIAAGIWLALATLLRVYPILLFAYPLLRREWRLVAGGIGGGVAVTALTLPVIGPGEYLAYILREAPASAAEWVNDAHNVSLRGWLGDWFIGNNTVAPVWDRPALVTPLTVVGMALIAAVFLWRHWRARHAPVGSVADELAWLLALPAALLISPLAWPHYFDTLILPGAVALAAVARQGAPVEARWLLGGAVALSFVHALGLQALFPLPRVLAWPAGLFVFALPFYSLIGWFGGIWIAARWSLAGGAVRGAIPTLALAEGDTA